MILTMKRYRYSNIVMDPCIIYIYDNIDKINIVDIHDHYKNDIEFSMLDKKEKLYKAQEDLEPYCKGILDNNNILCIPVVMDYIDKKIREIALIFKYIKNEKEIEVRYVICEMDTDDPYHTFEYNKNATYNMKTMLYLNYIYRIDIDMIKKIIYN